MKSYHIDHQSFFRLFAASPPPRYIIASYGQGEMWYLRGSDEPGGPGFVSIPGAEWAADIPSNRPEWVAITGDEWREAVRAVANVRPPDAMGYLIYGWMQWRIAAGAKLE